MKNREVILEEFQKAPENTLIVTSKLYRKKFSNIMSEAAFAQTISRLAKKGEIRRVSKGIYCRPRKSRFGIVPPSDREIADIYTGRSDGMIVGYGLYNSLGISTQISKRLTAYSALADEQVKQIGAVTIHRYDLKYTDQVKSIISLMEILHHYYEIQDIDHSAFIRSVQALSKNYSDSAFVRVQKAIGYPKRTVAFLRDALNYYQIPNGLNRYLSELSCYRVPRMEDLYEAAQKSN
ncbi:MAG: hypothetical protein J5563_05000 [Clostridia bacterium]|nr:hypothetical protein [Clostridia bacterium]MBP1586938.1 hypothetical protein [Clostridia bacterium]MBR5059224.1 hypothetical protein [Clostridia bacterium]